uniref:PROP1-like PPR domain-containing protein n=1 Tax=Triticum urartu TaxID=4572 RepID=A0A8R7PBA6_TRIUA
MVSLAAPAFHSLASQASRACTTRASSQCESAPGRRGAKARPRAAGTAQAAAVEAEETPRFRWDALGSDLSEPQEQAMRGLSPKLPNRCRALMPRVVSLSPGDENLGVVLAFWVKAMKPKRADWLLVLKELKAMESPLLAEVLEYALLEDSFEANVRDYTKLMQIYGKQNLLREAEEAFQAMKARGLPCDQVMLTALVDMYSKAGDLTRANETFEEIVLLGLPLDKRAYGSMIMAYIRADMLDQAEDLIKQTEDQQVFAGKEVYKALLRAYSYKGDSEGAQRVFDAVQFAGTVPDTKLCALLVNAYCLSNRIDEAVCVTRNMRSVGLEPCDRCVTLILGAYDKANKLEGALEFLAELEENGVVIGQEPSQLLAAWFGRLGVVHEVEQVLEEVSKSSKSKQSVSLLKEGTKSWKSKDRVKKEWRKGKKSKHSISVHQQPSISVQTKGATNRKSKITRSITSATEVIL